MSELRGDPTMCRGRGKISCESKGRGRRSISVFGNKTDGESSASLLFRVRQPKLTMTRVPSGVLTCDYISVYRPLFFPSISSVFFPTTCRICPPSLSHSRGSSTRTLKTAAQSSPSRVLTLRSSPVTPVKARDIASRLAMPLKFSGCPSIFSWKKVDTH